ncbi:cupin domain-containing protein [Halobellus captivus]|uniref:cupin domain-containing protein n=1 Tax=Halobellus captivus TaxID=2592614 RepID=UPI0011A447ED|nr:cupin domain-containing protein [Halobellus captivus]
MQKVTLDDLENDPFHADVTKHATEPLNLNSLALNYFELEPGDELSGGLHTHMNQEEVFYVVEGTATFHTKGDEMTVEAGEIVRFAPGEYQSGKNEGEQRVRVIALGAPQDAGETRVAAPCQECGADYHVAEAGDDGISLSCPDCGNEPEQ